MKVIICTGSPWTNLDLGKKYLQGAGLAEPRVVNSLDIDTLHEHVKENLGIQGYGVPQEPVVLSKLAEQQAMGLVSANLRQPLWGWSDPWSTWLLDFWRELDQSFYFLLMYSAPEVELANFLFSEKYTESALAFFSQESQAYNTKLLQFYNRNRDRALLIGAEAPVVSRQEFDQLVADRFMLTGSLPEQEGQNSATPDRVAIALAHDILKEWPERTGLYAEMQASASLPCYETEKDSLHEAFACHRQTTQDVSELQQQIIKIKTTSQQQAEENELLLLQLHQVQEELEKVFEERNDLEKSHDLQSQQSKKELDKLIRLNNDLTQQLKQKEQQVVKEVVPSTKLQELEQENELLLLQLHQVQEELEHYFLLYQDSAADKKLSRTDSTRVYLPANQFQSHHNWYELESDEKESWRWFGPEPGATIYLPVNRDNDMLLVIHYKDILRKKLLKKMTIVVDGVELPFKVYKKIQPKCIVVKVPAVQQQNDQLELTLNLTTMLRPSDLNEKSSDNRLLGLAVLGVSCLPQQPGIKVSLSESSGQSSKLKLFLAKNRLSLTRFPLSHFDGVAYLQQYPDVAKAVAQGASPSGLYHFVMFGYSHGYKCPLAVERRPVDGDRGDLTVVGGN